MNTRRGSGVDYIYVDVVNVLHRGREPKTKDRDSQYCRGNNTEKANCDFERAPCKESMFLPLN